jgi:tetratricopeptide (TPR) repeat protein
MFNSLNRAKKIAKILYQDYPHPTATSILFYLGFCEQQRRRFSDALNHYQQYLKIHENERMECLQSGHCCNTANVLLHIANLGAHCSCDVSYRLSCIEKALQIEDMFHGKASNHCHLAICFGTLGYCLITENRESKGFEYLGKAIQMLEQINLDSDEVFYGHSQLTIGEMLEEDSPNKAEKHLRTAGTVLKKTLKDNSHVALLQINSALLKVFLQTNRIQDGLEVAKQRQRLIDTVLSEFSAPNADKLCHMFHLAAFYEDSGR